MLAQQPTSALSLMDSRFRRLLPSWLSTQQPSLSPSNVFPESDPQRTVSAGSKEDFQRLFQKSFTVQASSASDSLLSITALSRSRLYRPEQTVAERDTLVSVDRSGRRTLHQELSRITSWDFNVVEVDRLSGRRPLRTVLMHILELEGLLGELGLDRARVEAFVAAVEERYDRRNPYHNSVHAADVVQGSWLFLRAAARTVAFPRLEVFSLLLAAAVHDLAHPGVTNDFLVRTCHALAARFGGRGGGVNERHHVASFLGLLDDPATDAFAGLGEQDQQRARQFVQQAVMSTDMGSHQELVDQLAASRAERPDIGARSGDPGARALLLQFLLHAADLCNPCRPPPLGTAWGERVCGEFLAQGDTEAQLGLSVTPFCDRRTVVVSATQLRFIDIFLRPLLPHLAWAVGGALARQLEAGLAQTVEHWTEHRRRVEEGAANPHLARLSSQPEAESSLTRVTSLPCQPVPAFA